MMAYGQQHQLTAENDRLRSRLSEARNGFLCCREMCRDKFDSMFIDGHIAAIDNAMNNDQSAHTAPIPNGR